MSRVSEYPRSYMRMEVFLIVVETLSYTSFSFQCKGQPTIVTRHSIQMIYYHIFFIFCIVTVEREKNLPRLPFKEAVRILSHLPLNLYYVTKTWSWRCRYGVKLSVVSAECFKLLFCFRIQYTQKPFAFNTPYPRSVCFWWKMFGSSAKSSTSSCLDVFPKVDGLS